MNESILQGRVARTAARHCYVLRSSGEEVSAVLRGKLFKDDVTNRAVVGDEVVLVREGDAWAVDEVKMRRNEYVRKGLRNERQVLFANVERVLIIASLAQPVTKAAAIDRFLVAALRGGISPMLVLTKTDLDPEHVREHELRAQYAAFDLRVFPVNNAQRFGYEELQHELSSGTTALIGNSGVGKSSLLNGLIPGLDLETREVSAWSGKGTHTTTAALLVPVSDRAALIDTPGMKSFAPYGIDRENLLDLFPDLAEHARECRFTNCSHQSEPGCAIVAALVAGEVAESRLSSYHRLLSEL